MKENFKTFWRTFFITSVIILCVSIAFSGIAIAYESTQSIGFGQNKKALELGKGYLRILDYVIKY